MHSQQTAPPSSSNSEHHPPSHPRVAWLLTSAFYYWHPTLSAFAKIFPEMTAFAANWRGYAPGLENTFAVEVVGQRQVVPLKQTGTGYRSSFTYLPVGIVKHLLRLRPHVVFSNSFGMWTLLALLFKSWGKWRVVVAYEGSSPSVDYCHSPLRLALRRAMVQAADACITNSQAGQDYLVNTLHTPPARVFVHPYEVPDVQSFTNSPAHNQPANHPSPVFLFVGGLIPRKGVTFLLEACSQLQKQGYRNYTLLIVGDGEQRSQLETFSQNQGLNAQIHWVGKVPYQDLGSYFHGADVSILPTLEDTWGLVVLEAMAVGKAVLVSQYAGACELVADGENGYRFDPHHPQQLATLMANFIENRELAAKMGNKSKQFMDRYTPQAAAEFLQDVTHFVLGDCNNHTISYRDREEKAA
jgi:glycosyltransferase involved in cell wall biosynthesis